LGIRGVKVQRRPAKYDRFGGVGISMTRQSKIPREPSLPEHLHPGLLLRANDLRFRAKNLRKINLQ
jgi:hypothetical protein